MSEKLIDLEPIFHLNRDMVAKLKANKHKTGWKDIDPLDLLQMLEDEVGELRMVLEDYGFKYDATKRHASLECADIANFAMMIHDIVTHDKYKEVVIL